MHLLFVKILSKCYLNTYVEQKNMCLTQTSGFTYFHIEI